MIEDRSGDRYTLRRVQQLLGLSRATILGVIGTRLIAPKRGRRNEYLFTFQDLVVLRAAADLQAAKLAPRTVLSSLRRLRKNLPKQLPTSGLRITVVGSEIAVRDARSPWQADSGQLLMDFEMVPTVGSITLLQHAPKKKIGLQGNASGLFAEAESVEESDPKAAEAAYREVLQMDPDFADAYLNLGAMLCETRRTREAVKLFDTAIERFPDIALLHFNRAIALEDLGRLAEALQSYSTCLALDPALVDAHFNAARLHTELGNAKGVVRHLSAYRRLRADDDR